MAPPLFGLTREAFRTLARARFVEARGVVKGAGSGDELYRRFFRTGQWLGADLPAREVWARVADPRPLFEDDGEITEADEAGLVTRKRRARLADGSRVEVVLIPMDGGQRATLCLSCQVGCALGCAFCETGKSGLLRSLTAAEIVAQVHQARFAWGWDFSSVVFMGMGEPFDNPEGVLGALEVLLDPAGLAFAQEKITVCTAGVPEGLRAWGRRGWRRMGLSLSLHAGTDDRRSRLMPVTRAYPLAEVARALVELPKRDNFVLALNWCLLPGYNDSDEAADEAAAFAAGLGRVVFNVIPYNPGDAPLTRPPTPAEVEAFVTRLRQRGLAVKLRDPRGQGIAAACGQLAAQGTRTSRPLRAGEDQGIHHHQGTRIPGAEKE